MAALDGALPDDGKREAINAVQKLTGPQVDRLFTILPEGSHCDYTLATAKMRLYFNSDAELEDLGLVKTAADPVTFDNEMARVAAEGSDIGKPRNCYRMTVSCGLLASVKKAWQRRSKRQAVEPEAALSRMNAH